jgi:hypothetical protein
VSKEEYEQEMAAAAAAKSQEEAQKRKAVAEALGTPATNDPWTKLGMTRS